MSVNSIPSTTSAIDAVLAASNQKPSSNNSATTGSGDVVDQNMFLKLLVAQLSHQNPLSPADGLQFVTQLAQFTTLEQSSQMRSDVSAIRDLLTKQFSAPATGTNTGTSQASTN